MSNKHAKLAEQLLSVRATTRSLVTSMLTDNWPSDAAVVDFGVDSRKHYEALCFPIREAEIMPKELDAALGDGMRLTTLTRNADSNPHKDVEFHTAMDLILGRNDKTATRTIHLSPPDAADFWRCQGLSPPWETQAGLHRSAPTAEDGKISLGDLRTRSQERESGEAQRSKSMEFER